MVPSDPRSMCPDDQKDAPNMKLIGTPETLYTSTHVLDCKPELDSFVNRRTSFGLQQPSGVQVEPSFSISRTFRVCCEAPECGATLQVEIPDSYNCRHGEFLVMCADCSRLLRVQLPHTWCASKPFGALIPTPGLSHSTPTASPPKVAAAAAVDDRAARFAAHQGFSQAAAQTATHQALQLPQQSLLDQMVSDCTAQLLHHTPRPQQGQQTSGPVGTIVGRIGSLPVVQVDQGSGPGQPTAAATAGHTANASSSISAAGVADRATAPPPLLRLSYAEVWRQATQLTCIPHAHQPGSYPGLNDSMPAAFPRVGGGPHTTGAMHRLHTSTTAASIVDCIQTGINTSSSELTLVGNTVHNRPS